MNYKEWEARLKEQQALEAELIEWEHKREVAAADLKRAQAHVKRMKANRPPMFRPDRPVQYSFTVTLAARDQDGNYVEVSLKIDTMSELEAEQEAARQIRALGMLWRGVIETKRM